MAARIQRDHEVVMERLDDIPLLTSPQQLVGLGEVIDEAIDRR